MRKKKQKELASVLLRALNFEEERGRLDVSAHPFTTTLGYDDVRVTARYSDAYVKTGIFSVIHECGHALYELGFPAELRGTLVAGAASLGIHESQSRLWENVIGRSLPFWSRLFPQFQKMFPAQTAGVTLGDFYRGINKVESSLIRIEADEVTYGLHIALRFDLETKLVSGELPVADLPAVWNDKTYELLGIRPSNDAEGVLQDVHWSFGGIGYFPTYALGNLYAAQFYAKMKAEIPDLDDRIREGDLLTPLLWLRKKIHVHGALCTANELCETVTGERLNPDWFLKYLEEKFRPIYEL